MAVQLMACRPKLMQYAARNGGHPCTSIVVEAADGSKRALTFDIGSPAKQESLED